MRLLTKQITEQAPRLGETGHMEAKDIKPVAKFFTPDSNWTWYLVELDPEEGLAFGLVDGFEKELGYFSIPELEELRGAMGLPVERDLHWTPKTLAELMEVS